jgi:hypothetical protein
MKTKLSILLSLLFLFLYSKGANIISLEGEWQFSPDSADVGIAGKWFSRDFSDHIFLPGTTDDGQKGIPNTLQPAITRPQILHLTRKYSYTGPAWYKKEVIIPSDWKGKNIRLKLERVIWQTSLWIDGAEVEQRGESLITPQYFDLTGLLTPGKHSICMRIDNRKKYDISIDDKGHSYTNETQIMWNGVIGELALIAEDAVFIKQIDVYPDITRKNIRAKIHLKNTASSTSGKLIASVRLPEKNISLENVVTDQVTIDKGEQFVEILYPMGNDIYLWSELTPFVYELTVSLDAGMSASSKSTTFGMREIKQQNTSILINGKRVFMRGTLECCIFPLTGHPPMDKAGWRKVMESAREWGLNHLRFHSWCPPEAAFEVADETGFYLQVELPFWSAAAGKDTATNRFLYEEADRIVAVYGNHPSFCFFSMGNELQPDFNFLKDLMLHIKTKDPRHLYTTTSFTFEEGHGHWPEPDDDFFITQWTKNGWVRGQGIFNMEPPCFDKDYSEAVKGMTVPLITHEVGQYAVYPNLKETEKYTGVMDPLNFKGIKKELEQKRLLDKADDYLNASGKLAALLYKEEIERALKTPGCSGFQLLDLHDFPGQGTALVGLLDAFWDSKGLIDPAEFRQFCSPVVPLTRFSKASWLNSETFHATVEIANFGEQDLSGQTVTWQLKDSKGQTKREGSIKNVTVSAGFNQKIGEINCPLTAITKAVELTLSVSVDNTDYTNSWRVWVYPEFLTIEKGDVIVTDNLKEAEKALKEGKKVLFNPSYETLTGLEGKFLPVFWSPVHFPKQAGSMGILCDPGHKVFTHFPTRMHTDWQWWHLLTESKTLLTDSLYKEMEPLTECVDNFANNRRLATLFETNCEKGKLIVCSMDLLNNTSVIPEKRQLLYSILEYMNSTDFAPEKQLSFNKIASLIDPVKKEYKRATPESIY